MSVKLDRQRVDRPGRVTSRHDSPPGPCRPGPQDADRERHVVRGDRLAVLPAQRRRGGGTSRSRRSRRRPSARRGRARCVLSGPEADEAPEQQRHERAVGRGPRPERARRVGRPRTPSTYGRDGRARARRRGVGDRSRLAADERRDADEARDDERSARRRIPTTSESVRVIELRASAVPRWAAAAPDQAGDAGRGCTPRARTRRTARSARS